MYCLESFAETSPEILRALIQRYPLATLVSMGGNGLEANHIPLYLAPGEGPQRKKFSLPWNMRRSRLSRPAGRRMPARISWRLSGSVPKHCAQNARG